MCLSHAAIIGQRIRAQRVINNQTFERLTAPAAGCTASTALLVLVTSAVDNWERRQAIRDTWGGGDALAEVGGRLLFLLGETEPESAAAIRAEAQEYGDILQEAFRDSYRNLTLKTMMGLRWTAEHCDKVNFVVKTDDDIYWNLPLLMSHLETFDDRRFITGCIKQYSAPEPISMSGAQAPPGYPLFAAGAGYVLTGDLTADLYQAARRIRLLPVEDVFITGFCAKMAQAWPPRHHEGFSCGNILADDCDLVQLFNAHKITPARQYLIWDKFTTDPNPCMDF
ncbi:beta-1,3-galactosyltransferase 1-like [Pollicipes pollicipes]|uniref:beta-1,3-galactosyltransferase 1-like n=1 Tax=Pollicipes pollicipes TaxID=41117 RepID=UPI0018852707|nr:beta-1,3-galactosyltransferase 1-like [Pollicipes pollicipes]